MSKRIRELEQLLGEAIAEKKALESNLWGFVLGLIFFGLPLLFVTLAYLKHLLGW